MLYDAVRHHRIGLEGRQRSVRVVHQGEAGQIAQGLEDVRDENAAQARKGARNLHVGDDKSGVRVRAAQKDRMQRALRAVVGRECAQSLHQPNVLDTLDRLANAELHRGHATLPGRFRDGDPFAPQSAGARWGAPVDPLKTPGRPLRLRIRRSERDQGKRAGLTTDERERLRALERENRELARPTRFSQGVGLFCPGGARPAGSSPDCVQSTRIERRLRGSSRSAGSCRSPRRRTASMSRASAIRRRRRLARSATPSCARDPARVRRQLPGLRRAQGVAAVAAGRRGHCALHSRPA